MTAGSEGCLEAASRLPVSTALVPKCTRGLSQGAPNGAYHDGALRQALAKHIKQLVALQDELRDITIPAVGLRSSVTAAAATTSASSHCLATALAEELRPRACPLARLLRACGRLRMHITLPACFSLGVSLWQEGKRVGRRCSCTCDTRRRPQAPGADALYQVWL